MQNVRCGNIDADIIETLSERVFECSIAEKFTELSSSGKPPVCLFPTRKQCEAVNAEMLALLDSEVQTLNCTDEVDETKSLNKWHKKAAEQLDKMNADCNNTGGGGLQAVLHLAVGARVMLRRNIDVKLGLVNGAIGTVTDITQTCVSVQFDHLDRPCEISRVKGKFIVMKNYYIYRTQFPLMLAYAVTIHKCQGLSLDSAIVDLSEKVFADGMAYVALSRVRSITGLHIVSFEPQSIRVSTSSLKEINRLRKAFRKDLPPFAIPVNKRPKRKLTGECDGEQPESKRRRTRGNCAGKRPTTSKNPPPQSCGEKRPSTGMNPPSKVPRNDDKCNQADNKPNCSCGTTPPATPQVWPFSFHCVDMEWQHSVCESLAIPFVKPHGVQPGASDMPLTRPCSSIPIVGDGNCMFRSLSYIVSGSEDHHLAVRAKIMQHMKAIPSGSDVAHRLVQHMKGYDVSIASINDYLHKTHMENQCVWGRDIELLTFAHLTNTSVFAYNVPNKTWERYGPDIIDKDKPFNSAAQAVYLKHTHDHFMVVQTTEPVSPEQIQASKDHSKESSKTVEIPPDPPTNVPPVPPKDTPSEKLDSGITDSINGVWPHQRFCPVNGNWQGEKCSELGLPLHKSHAFGSDAVLTRPDPQSIHNIKADGNCLFRCFSYILTGEERHFIAVRQAIVKHFYNIPEYIADSKEWNCYYCGCCCWWEKSHSQVCTRVFKSV